MVPCQTQNQIYVELLSGRLDASFQDAEAATKGFLNRPEAHDSAFAGAAVADEKLPGEGVGYGIRREDVALKKAVAELKADRTIDRWASKYFSVKVVAR